MNDPLDRQIGQRIRAFRMAQNMSQSELGRRMGVSFQQIQKYEKGQNRVGGGRIKKLAASLDVSVAALFGAAEDRGQKKVDALLTEMMTHPYAASLLQAFFSLPSKKEQRAVLAMLQAMASNSSAKRRMKAAGAPRATHRAAERRRALG